MFITKMDYRGEIKYDLNDGSSTIKSYLKHPLHDALMGVC